MLAHSSSPSIDFIHYSTLIHSTATVHNASYAALGHTQSTQQENQKLVMHCVAQLLQRLETTLPQHKQPATLCDPVPKYALTRTLLCQVSLQSCWAR